MPCDQVAPGVIVCSLPYVRTSAWCVTCEQPRPMAGTYGYYYGSRLTCLVCGDAYDSDWCGTRHEIREPRPFRRNWKRERISSALRMWRNAMPLRLEVERQRRAYTEDVPAGVTG